MTKTTTRRQATELEMDLPGDEEDWVRAHPVYCPVSWCSAHKLRRVRCGDVDGPYEGIHVGRMRAVRRVTRHTQRRLKVWQAAGLSEEDALLVEGVLTLVQDAKDMGNIKPGPVQKRRTNKPKDPR